MIDFKENEEDSVTSDQDQQLKEGLRILARMIARAYRKDRKQRIKAGAENDNPFPSSHCKDASREKPVLSPEALELLNRQNALLTKRTLLVYDRTQIVYEDSSNMLEHLITSKAKRQLLKLFFTNPGSAFYTREIARLTGESINGVRRELSHLEKAGLVKARSEGNMKYYSLIKEFPLYPELKKIIYTTIGLGDYLKTELKEPRQIELAFIYGSVAGNGETARSDIDLFVVGEIDEVDLHTIVSRAEADIRRSINYVLMSKDEFRKRLAEGEPFVKRVMGEDKIVLRGNPDVY